MSSARSVGAFRDPLMEEARRRRVGIVAFCGASVGRGIFGTVKSGLYICQESRELFRCSTYPK